VKTLRINLFTKIALFLSLTVLLSGCFEKQLSQFKNSSTEKMVFKAKDMEAGKYATQLYSTATTELEASKRTLSQGNYKEAYEHSKNAANAAKQAFDTAQSAKAEADFNMAEQKFKVATENEGARTNKALYTKIQENLEKARKYHARSKKNYQLIIQSSNLVIDDVKTLLAEVTKLADKEVNEASMIFDDARRNEAETRAPDAWIKAKALVDEALKLRTDEQYYKAIEKAKEAQTQANEANQLAMESKSREEMVEAEQRMGDLKEVEANKYVRSRFTIIEENYLRAQQAYRDKDYRIAIDVARRVIDQAPPVIEESSRLQLQDQIRIAQLDIDKLKINDAEKYAPTFLSEAEALLEEAKKSYKNQEFDEVKSLQKEIRTKIDLASDRLRVRAEDHIRDAEIAIKDAEDTGAANYAPELLKRAQEMRENSQKLLGRKMFRDSIIMAGNTVNKAQEAKTATIKKKAEISLNATEKVISNAVGDGAQLYATEDIQDARNVLKQGREALLSGQYSKALDLAIQVRNKVDDAYTTMRKKAVSQIDEARLAINKSDDAMYMVSHYPQAVQTLNSARQKLGEAEAQLNAKQFARAIEKAVDSRGTAIDAKNTAIKLQVADRTPAVQRQINEARIAKAYTYSIEEYDQALNNLKSCQENIGNGKYDTALDNLNDAEKHAETALKGQIIKARNMIESAKAVGAWKLDAPQLQGSVIALDNAERNMKSGNYAESLTAANASISASVQAQQTSRDKIFYNEISQINMLLANAKLASALIPDKVADIQKNTVATEKKYRENKDVVGRFTEGMDSLTKLKTDAANLDSEAKAKRERYVKDIKAGMDKAQAYKAETFAEKELDRAQDSFRAAEAAYTRADFVNARLAYESSLASLKDIELRKQENDYKQALRVQIDHLNRAMGDFSEVVELSPEFWKQIKGDKLSDSYDALEKNFSNVVAFSPEFLQGMKGDLRSDPYKNMQGKMTSGKFRQILTESYARVKALKPPSTMTGIHNKALKMFEEAKIAGDYFDKFGYSKNYTPQTRNTFIDQAFFHLKACWQIKYEVDNAIQVNQKVQANRGNFFDWAFKNSKKEPSGDSFIDWVKKI
jgi:hypothetical protein